MEAVFSVLRHLLGGLKNWLPFESCSILKSNQETGGKQHGICEQFQGRLRAKFVWQDTAAVICSGAASVQNRPFVALGQKAARHRDFAALYRIWV
jgi:hypothetical protein